MADVDEVRLDPSVAIVLLRAMLADITESSALPAIVLKGRALEFHQLAPPKTSADVDLLVRSQDATVVAERLADLGWRARPWCDPDEIFPQHSVTYFHPQWPVDVDVHFRFPGCERDADEVLEALIARGLHVQEAGRAVLVPSLEHTIVVGAVHLLRDAPDDSLRSQLSQLAVGARERANGEAVVAAARELGALATAEPFLREAFPDETPDDCGRVSDEWLVFSQNSQAASVRLEYLLNKRGRSLRGMVRRALWPSREAMAATDLGVLSMQPRDLLRARIRRLRRAISSLPTTLRETQRYFSAARSMREARAADRSRAEINTLDHEGGSR